MFEWLANNLTLHFVLLAALRVLKILKTSNFRCFIYCAGGKTHRKRLKHCLRRSIHRKLWSLVFWHSNCHRKAKCKVRLLASHEFCRGRFYRTSKSKRLYISRTRRLRKKSINIYIHTAMIKAATANIMTLYVLWQGLFTLCQICIIYSGCEL